MILPQVFIRTDRKPLWFLLKANLANDQRIVDEFLRVSEKYIAVLIGIIFLSISFFEAYLTTTNNVKVKKGKG